jgi:peptide/nickel transport system ATP-binding protein
VPVANPDRAARRRRIILAGDVPSPVDPPSGCRFHTRCWLRRQLGDPENCVTERPALRSLRGDHQVSCHWAEELQPGQRRDELIAAAAAMMSGLTSAQAAESEVVPQEHDAAESLFRGDGTMGDDRRG